MQQKILSEKIVVCKILEQKKLGLKYFGSKNILGEKRFEICVQIDFGFKKCWVKQIWVKFFFWVHQTLGPKILNPKKILGSKQFWVHKSFAFKTFGSKKRTVLKNFDPKNCKFQKIFLSDQFWFQINFGLKENFSFTKILLNLKLCPKLFLNQRNWSKKSRLVGSVTALILLPWKNVNRTNVGWTYIALT